MTQPPSFKEELISQIPAVRLLMAMGYQYLTPEEALALRGGKKNRVILEGVLEPWLKANNQITFKGQSYPFSESNIRRAIETLRDEPFHGLVPTNQRVYELLTLGTSLQQISHEGRFEVGAEQADSEVGEIGNQAAHRGKRVELGLDEEIQEEHIWPCLANQCRYLAATT